MQSKESIKVVLKRESPAMPTANERSAIAQRLTDSYTKRLGCPANAVTPTGFSPEQLLYIAKLNLNRALDGLTGWGVLLVTPPLDARLCKAADGLLTVVSLHQWIGQPDCLLTTRGDESLDLLQKAQKERVLVILTPRIYRKFVAKLNLQNKYLVDLTKPESEDPLFRLFFL